MSSAPIRRAAVVASASRVCSSVTVRILTGRPSAVRSTDEVERPDVVRASGGHMPGRPLAPAPSTRPRWQPKPLVAPQALHPLAVTQPALAAEQSVDTPIAVTGMTPGEQPQPLPQQQLVRDLPPTVTLRGAMLPRRLAGSALRDPETTLQVHDRPAPPLRGQKFPRDTSRNMSISSACSPTIRFSRAFSFSNCFNRTTSSGRIALNWLRQR